MSLFNVGAALFFDQGRAWDSVNDNPALRDIGIGLRLSPTRTGAHGSGTQTVIHLDIAKPLDAPADIRSLQWLIQVKSRF